jgi:two-component system sensor histidine kinase SenX3
VNRRPLFIALLWPSALVLLVGVLAFFQYRWLGQVSEADRDRQRSTLNQRAREFAGDFDREIGAIYGAMQYDASNPDNATNIFANKFAEWHDRAAFPRIVKNVYLTDEPVAAPGPLSLDDVPVTLSKFDPGTRTFAPVEWPATLTPIRERLTTMRHKFTAPSTPFSSSGNTTFRFVSVAQQPVFAQIPALLIPAQSIQRFGTTGSLTKDILHFESEPRYVIVELDKQVITDVMLPALVEKHLAVDDYKVEVMEGRSTPIFRKGLTADANLSPATADASTTFFNVRADSLALSAVRGLPIGGSVAVPLPAAADSASRMSIIVSDAPRAATKDAPAVQDFRATSDARQGVEAALQNRVATLGRGGGGAGGSVMYGPGAWQLVLQHPAGSLEAAVAKARRRNLAISFGVLAVLSVSVFMISINAQRSKALAAQQMDFVATVSHELRTPIAVIRSAAQNLSAGVIQDPSRAKKYGELIDTEGRRLTDMVEEVLEFAGISGGKRQFAMAPADIGRLTTDVVESCRALIAEAGFVVELAVAPGLPHVNLDEPAYRRALNNLVTNALKYASDGKWLAVTVFQTPDRQIAVSVADKGRGVDPKDLPHIFEAFYRGAYAKDRQIHGNGLGLSLVKRIVDAHGGSVSVQTSPTGSTFTMKFHEASGE